MEAESLTDDVPGAVGGTDRSGFWTQNLGAPHIVPTWSMSTPEPRVEGWPPS